MNWIASIKTLLKYPLFSVPIIGVLLALALTSILYFFNSVELSNFLIIIILAFLASDVLTVFLIKGGHGIFQFSPIGTLTQPKGYAFMIFFVVIIVVAVVVNITTQRIIDYISSLYTDFIKVLIICLVLSGLVYLDMCAKFYAR